MTRDGQNPSSVSHLVLIGGSCKIPHVGVLFGGTFSQATIHLNRDKADEILALGAALRIGVDHEVDLNWQADLKKEANTLRKPLKHRRTQSLL